MEAKTLDQTLDRVREHLATNDMEGAIAIILALRTPDQAELFGDLPPEQQDTLAAGLSTPEMANILEEMEEVQAADLARRLEPEDLADILDEMEPDEAADILGDLAPQQVHAILSQMEDADEVRPLLLHRDETAGGLMTSEFLALRSRMAVSEALTAIRRYSPDTDTAYLFVVSAHGHLTGVVSLFHLIKAQPTTRIEELADPDVISVRTEADQEQCAQLMARYDLTALPVVDGEGRLIGVISVDDLVDVLQEEATEDFERFGGALPLGRPYLDSNPIEVAGRRVGWLLLLFVTGTLTGTVLRHFEDQLAAVVALATFIPLIVGTGGNAGFQATSTLIRSLALGDVDSSDSLRVWWHETRVALLLGTAMGIAAYVRAITWGTGVPVAITVSLGIIAIVLWANTVGALLPLIASRLRVDPTLVSGPFMSTLVDATGLLIYLSLARFILRV
ncbi:MAG: magnesium transporter [Chloroflexi bacterium]|nr:magnesium transporter [Chloroflexota bacterium]